jgi:hypothetical protein
MKCTLSITGLLILLCLAALTVRAQDDFAKTRDRLIQLVAKSPEFTAWLKDYPNWKADAGTEDKVYWYVGFVTADGEESLGYAIVEEKVNKIITTFIPRPLPPAAFQAGQKRMRTLVLDDPEVQKRLVDPALWYLTIDYNRFEAQWEAYLSRGIEVLVVKATLENDKFSIKAIQDANVLTQEQTEREAKDKAINLAYQADGIDKALAGFDTWKTYVQHHGGARYSVQFSAEGRELFHALVDVKTGAVIESGAAAR